MTHGTCDLAAPLGEHSQDDEVLGEAVGGAFDEVGSAGETLGNLLAQIASYRREEAERAELLASSPLGTMAVDEVKTLGLELAVTKHYDSQDHVAYDLARKMLRELEA